MSSRTHVAEAGAAEAMQLEGHDAALVIGDLRFKPAASGPGGSEASRDSGAGVNVRTS